MNRFFTLALLAGTLGAGSLTAVAAEPKPAELPPCPPPAAAEFRQGPGPGSFGMRHGRMPMQQMLKLSERQEDRLRDMRQTHFRESAPLRQELMRLRGELASESVRKHPDDRKLAELSEQIGRQHAKLAMLESRHLRQMSTVLDRRQIDTLLRMSAQRGFHKGRNW